MDHSKINCDLISMAVNRLKSLLLTYKKMLRKCKFKFHVIVYEIRFRLSQNNTDINCENGKIYLYCAMEETNLFKKAMSAMTKLTMNVYPTDSNGRSQGTGVQIGQ